METVLLLAEQPFELLRSGSGFKRRLRLSLQPLTQRLLGYEAATADTNCWQVLVLNGVVQKSK